MKPDKQEFDHPSYAMVGFSRGQIGGGGRMLFGSSVKSNHIISLRITRATRVHEMGNDWYFGGRKELIEVELTETQFAQLITTMNQGDGVPCTLNYYNGEIIRPDENMPPSEAELIHRQFKAEAKEITDKLAESVNAIKDIANNSKLSQKDKKAIAEAADRFANHANHHLPFLLSQLKEAADKVITQVKTEVLAFTDRTLKAAGMSHMKEQAPTLIEDKKEKPL